MNTPLKSRAVIQRVDKKQYEKAVGEVTTLFKRYKHISMEIAEIALSVISTLPFGMKAGKHIYTVKNFAKDTGINQSSLESWICDYRNVHIKLTKKQKKDPPNRNMTRRIIKEAGTRANSSTVRETFERLKKQDKEEPELRQLEHDLRNIHSTRFRVQSSWVLKSMDQEKIRELHSVIKLLNKLLNDHFKGLPKTTAMDIDAAHKKIKQVINRGQ